MATSKFQDLRTAFKTLVTPITDCEVTAYPPIGNEFTIEDRVWVGEIRVQQEKLTFGGPRDEDIEIEVVVFAPRFGFSQDEMADAETRAESILAAIEADLRSDPTVGGTVMTSDIASFTSSFTAHERGPVCQIELLVTAEANL